MFKNIFARMIDIDSYGIVSICLFVTVFVSAVAVAILMKKPLARTMGNLPLNDGEPVSTKGNSHE